jgi:hypothetical protein
MTSTVTFLARLQAANRVQVPVEVRWRHRLEPGELLSVEVRTLEGFDRETFHVRLQDGWRFTVPNEVVEVLGLKQGEMLRVTLECEGEDLS